MFSVKKRIFMLNFIEKRQHENTMLQRLSRGHKHDTITIRAHATVLHRVSKNEPTSASCSFVKHGLVNVIMGKQYQRTFRNYMLILFHCIFTFRCPQPQSGDAPSGECLRGRGRYGIICR